MLRAFEIAGLPGRRGGGAVRRHAERLPLRRPAARRHGGRDRPHRHAAGGRAEPARGQPVPDEPAGRGPDDGRPLGHRPGPAARRSISAPTSPPRSSRRAERCGATPLPWVLLGLLFAFVAQLLTFPFAESLLRAVADNDMALSLTSRALIPMSSTGVAYILLRCWALPPEPRRLTSVLLHPLLLVLSLVVMARAWVAVAQLLGAIFLPWAERLALRWGTTTRRGGEPELRHARRGRPVPRCGLRRRRAARRPRAAPRGTPRAAARACLRCGDHGGLRGLVTTALPGSRRWTAPT